MSKDFDYNLIRIFVSVIEHKSMGRAADALDVGGSTVSYAINKLRDYYGDPLFVRVKNGINPTSLALNLYTFFKAAEEDISAGLKLKNGLSVGGEESRYLRIRANTIIEYWLSHYALEQGVISSQSPLEFLSGDFKPDERLDKLRMREVDMDIGLPLPSDPAIVSIPLFQLKYALVYHADNKEIHENITVEEWTKQQRLGWVSIEGGVSVTSGLEEIFGKRDLNMIYKSNSIINMLLSIAHNTSLSMASPTFLLPPLSQVIPITWCEPKFAQANLPYLHAHFHKSLRRDPAIEELVRIMLAT